MGLLDTLGSFSRRVGAGVGRIMGQVGTTLKRVGETALPVLKRVGQIALDNHQPIAAIAAGVADAMPENKWAQGIAAASVVGSAALTAKGIGKNWLGVSK